MLSGGLHRGFSEAYLTLLVSQTVGPDHVRKVKVSRIARDGGSSHDSLRNDAHDNRDNTAETGNERLMCVSEQDRCFGYCDGRYILVKLLAKKVRIVRLARILSE